MFTDTSVQSLCCGKEIMEWTGGDPCTDASLRTLAARKTLNALLESGVSIMVKNCQGHFVAYNSSLLSSVKQFGKIQLGAVRKTKG